MANSTLALLLGADRVKLDMLPTRQLEIKRLSEIVGEPLILTLRAVTQAEYREAQENAYSINKKGELDEMDGDKYQLFIVMHGLVDPDIKDAALLEHYGAATPKELLSGTRFLLPGEFTAVFNAIADLSGFGEKAVEQVKN